MDDSTSLPELVPGAIAGIIISLLGALAVLMVMAWYCCQTPQRNHSSTGPRNSSSHHQPYVADGADAERGLEMRDSEAPRPPTIEPYVARIWGPRNDVNGRNEVAIWEAPPAYFARPRALEPEDIRNAQEDLSPAILFTRRLSWMV